MKGMTYKGMSAVGGWLGPILDCLRTTGGSAKPKEVSMWIQRELKLPPGITETTTKTGVNRFYNQVAWARQFLVWHGLIDDSKRGMWTLTPLGWKTHLDDAAARKLLAQRNKVGLREVVWVVSTDFTVPATCR